MRIAVLGLGIIGSVWARHLASDGHQVRTWNRTAKPDAPGFAPDIATAVQDAELVLVVVADPPAVASVLAAAAPALRTNAIVAQHSTIGVDDTKTAARTVRAAGARYLDMPFTGSKPAAEARQNVFFVGDDVGALAEVEAIYRKLSKAILPMGGIGQASAVKLAFNLLIAGINQTMCESFELARRAGIDPQVYFNALDLNVAKSGLADLKKPKYLSGDWSPQFSIKHMHKDLRLALALGRAHGLGLATTTAVTQAYATAEASGRSDQDFAALLEIVRQG